MENNKMSASFKYCISMPVVLATLYLVGIANLPQGYYTFLRIFSFVFLGIFIFSYCTICSEELDISMLNFANIAAGAVLILFNPFAPIYMNKETWIIFDIIAAAVMLAVCTYILYVYFRKKR